MSNLNDKSNALPTTVVGKLRIELGVTSRIHWVTSAFLDRDIIIRDLNNTLNGAFVMIKLDSRDGWKTYKRNGKKRDQEVLDETISVYRNSTKDNEDITVIECDDYQPTGKIVKVLYTPEILVKGVLLTREEIPKNLTPLEIHNWRKSHDAYKSAVNNHRFIIAPVNDNYPYTYVRRNNCSRDTIEKLKDHYVELKINPNWAKGKRHPNGTISQVLGNFDDIKGEHKTLMTAEGMDYNVLSDTLVESFKTPEQSIKEWKNINENEYLQPDGIIRYDVRGKDNMISIDPPTARDLDDCLSVRIMPNGSLLVGVHIADVSHYVDEATNLDIMARRRQTSTYMVGECIPMLPRALSNNLCSLNPGEDKFTFSCYWFIDYHSSMQQRKLVTIGGPFFRKTITRSVCRFAYSQALSVMEKKEDDSTWSGIQEGASKDEIRQSIHILMNLHRCIRESLPNWVDLSRKGSELKFKLDDDGKIVDIVPYETSEANKMIETWMVEANCAAAKVQHRDMAVIRTHKGFSERRGEYLVNCLKAVGINISVKSKGAFIASIKAIPEHMKESIVGTVTFALEKAIYTMFPQDEDKEEIELSNDMLNKLVVGKSVEDALDSYSKFVYSEDMGHSGLDRDLYTHFTSPIRRYPDIMVHRNIAKTLVNKKYVYGNSNIAINDEYLLTTPSDVEDVLVLANKMKDKAKAVGKYSQLLHLNQYLKGLDKPIDCTGLVVNIKIVRGLISMAVSLDKIPIMVDNVSISSKGGKLDPFCPNIVNASFDTSKYVGDVEWKDGEKTLLTINTKFRVQLVYCHTTPPSSKIVILGPIKTE